MPDDKNIKNFTAADIEKYHQGSLSSKERHELEKAALDDPFLADAIEGYSTAGVNATADIAELKKKLSQRTGTGKVVEMHKERRTAFVWWKIAAMIVVVAGAGLLVYQLGFNKKSEDIAQNENKKAKEAISKDSGQASAPVITKADEKTVSTETAKNTSTPQKEKAGKVTVNKEAFGASQSKTDTIMVNSFAVNNKPTVTSAPSQALSTDKDVAKEIVKTNTSDDKQKSGEVVTAKKLPDADGDGVKDQFDRTRNATFYKTNQGSISNQRNENSLRNNIIRGRVTDANNFGVPFANITNISDSVGIYSDAKGYFNFISADSIMNVEVRSLGFNSVNTQLRNNVLDNQVVLKEDKSLNEVVITHKKPNASRFRESNMKIEEPEPADGWENYDVYLANNLKVPETIKMKEASGEVEVSFEVDKNGEPINIKIEKSLCKPCDQEAIRLIKDGPKWKRKAKKGRATVTVSF